LFWILDFGFRILTGEYMKSGILNHSISTNRILIMSTASLICAVILGFSALVRIPVPGTPVPVTLQTFALLAGAGLLGRYYSLQMVGWYLLLGLVGAPFFAGGGGYAHMIGAAGGYLWGFVLAAWVVGFFGRREGWISSFAVYFAAALVLYVPGLIQLKIVTGADWARTFAMGFYPFIVADIVKAIAASGGVRFSRRIGAQ